MGFVLDIKSFKKITERNILSSQEFFKNSYRKIDFIRKINNTHESSNSFLTNQDGISLEENKVNTTRNLSIIVEDSTISKVDSGQITLESNHNKTEIDFKLDSTPPGLKKNISEYKV